MKDPFDPLDEYEKELMEYTESEQSVPVATEKELKEYIRQVARNTTRKDLRMNLRMTERDMAG